MSETLNVEGTPAVAVERIVRPIAVEIVQALKNPRVLRWTTWDVFAGRQINHERGLSQEEAVMEVLKRHWPNADISDGENQQRNDTKKPN